MRNPDRKYRDYVKGRDWLEYGTEVRITEADLLAGGQRAVVIRPEHRVPAGVAVVQIIGATIAVLGPVEYEITELTVITPIPQATAKKEFTK
jgi:hypothetical protein